MVGNASDGAAATTTEQRALGWPAPLRGAHGADLPLLPCSPPRRGGLSRYTRAMAKSVLGILV